MCLFLLIFIVSVFCVEQEVCVYKKAFIHHNFFNCPPVILRRNPEWGWMGPYSWCENQGTWKGEKFKCYMPDPEEGTCKHGQTDHSETCIPKKLGSVEMWMIVDENSSWDWHTEVLDFRIRGNNGGIVANGSVIEDAYNLGYMHHIVSTYDYNETCLSNIKIYVNGTQLNATIEDQLDYYFWVLIRTFIYVEQQPESNEIVHFIGAWDIVLTPEYVLELFELGWDRDANTTVEHCEVMDLSAPCSTLSSIKHILWGALIPLIIITAVSLFGIAAFVYVWIKWRRRTSAKNPEKYKQLGSSAKGDLEEEIAEMYRQAGMSPPEPQSQFKGMFIVVGGFVALVAGIVLGLIMVAGIAGITFLAVWIKNTTK